MAADWQESRIGTMLSEGLRAALSSEIDWLSANGRYAGYPTPLPLTLIYFAGLEQVAPDAISVLR